jgi:HK97 family phage major capsid protein
MPTYVDPASRARLSDARERLADLRRQRQNAVDHRDAARSALQGVQASGTDLVGTPEFRRAEQAVQDVNRLQAQIASVEQEERYLLSRLAGTDAIGTRESFLSDPSAMEEIRMLAESTQPIGDRMLGTAVSRDQLLAEFEGRRNMMAAAGDVTLPSDAARTQFYGVVPQVRMPLTVLNLIPTETMEVGTFSYLQESGAFTGAAETADLALKPSATMATTDATCTARTIPAWIRASRPQLADVPGLTTTIQTRLRYIVERRLQAQILAGDGTGVNLLGILATSGIGAPASVTGDSVNADLVANGITSVLNSEAEPDAVVLNPSDWMKMIKVKASGSGERLDSDGALSVDTGSTIWTLPIIRTPAIASGTALIGSFSFGATLFLREGFNIRVSDSDQSDFLSNAVKLLGELRAGLAVWRPSCFAKVTLSFAN